MNGNLPHGGATSPDPVSTLRSFRWVKRFLKIFLKIIRRGWAIACLIALFSWGQTFTQNAQAVIASPRRVQKTSTRPAAGYGPAVKLATLSDPAINESSGIVASRSTPGLFWTHNDSGDGPFIYAFDTQGKRRGVWMVNGASAIDWEDIAAGPGPQGNVPYLYIGDIGDNDARRTEITVYRIPEPRITSADSGSIKTKPRVTEAAESIRLRYPDGSHDAEALLVHPVTGAIYIITKVALANAVVYEATSLRSGRLNTMKRISDLSLPSLFGGIVTGGDISPDGRRMALCDYLQGDEIVLPDPKADVNTIWKLPIRAFGLGERRQGEAIGYRLDGRAVLATSEGLPTPLIQVRFR